MKLKDMKVKKEFDLPKEMDEVKKVEAEKMGEDPEEVEFMEMAGVKKIRY